LTRSDKVREGKVIDPSSTTFAPIQQVTTISKLVAESFKRPPSVAIRMFANTGKVERVLTARPTMLNPFAKFSCKHEIFMFCFSAKVLL
jgi:hypothetical protein